MKFEREIPLINEDDEVMKVEHIIPYQKMKQDFRDTLYQYEFLDDKSKKFIDIMLMTMEDVHNAFLNLNDDFEYVMSGNQSIYDAICEQMQFSIGETVTAFIEDMDEEELKQNAIKVKGEDWYNNL